MLERTTAPTAGLATNIMAPQILLRRCSSPLATLQRRQLTHRPKLYQPPADGQIVQWLRSTDRQSSNQFRERFGRTSLRGRAGPPLPKGLRRFNAETSLSVTPFLFFANRGKEKIVQLKNGAGKIERVALP